MPIGRFSSLTAHRSWKISSARLRVLQKTRLVLCRSISRITCSAAQRPLWPGPGDVLVLGQHDRDLGLGAGIAVRRGRPARHRRAARASPDRPRDRRRWPTGRRGAAPARSRCSRASDSESRSPRLPVAKAWTSSTTTVERPANRVKLSSWLSSRLSDSGVVSRICGGRTRCRALRSEGVSPVRVSTRIGRRHLRDRRQQIALHVDRERLQRRDVERVQPVGRRLDQLGERRQEAGQRLAGAGRRDQQRAAARRAPPSSISLLVAAHRPALAGEPARDRLGSKASIVPQWPRTPPGSSFMIRPIGQG